MKKTYQKPTFHIWDLITKDMEIMLISGDTDVDLGDFTNADDPMNIG